MKDLFVLVTVFVCVWSRCAAGRPHIVFILADDLGYNDIGYHARMHDSAVRTPFLEQLASDGIKLENYYVQPICTPSRSQLMSGRYQIHTGLQHSVILPNQRNGLPLNNRIIPEQLRGCGYDTHMVGKWHLGYYKKEFMPQYRGFNSYFGYLNAGEDYYTHRVCGLTCGVDMRDTKGPVNATWGQYSTHLFTKQAKSVIDNRDKSKPLFLYLAYQAVHFPVEVPEQYTRPYMHIQDENRRKYAGMVAALDEGVRNVTQHLEEAGLLKDTIIIFSTDNGGQTLFGGNNWPLRGRKHTYWEGGVKGVGFVTGNPLGISNVTSNNFMHVADWLPTLLTATNCKKLNDTPPLDGLDQWNAILQKEKSPRSEVPFIIDPLHIPKSRPQYRSGFDISVQAAIRCGPWKLLTGDTGFSGWVKPPESQKYDPSLSPVHGKLLHDIESNLSRALEYETSYNASKISNNGLVQLYNIEDDPYERNEVSASNADVVDDLLKRLVAYNKTAVPVRYPFPDPFASPIFHGGYWGPWVQD